MTPPEPYVPRHALSVRIPTPVACLVVRQRVIAQVQLNRQMARERAWVTQHVQRATP
ncbi:MAG TPA: hypothetical protein VFT75_18390 [Nocardioidaceae bacterium]|nr:hypothetical protein [Nocardioidaceae bacterium]